MKRSAGRLRCLSVALISTFVLLAGCHSNPEKDLKKASAESLYRNAHKAMLGNDYDYAIKAYEALTARFPFTSQARQARLDLIYVYYRKGEKESATDAADQFLRENPTHPRVDYAWYMKGLVDYERTPWKIERFFGVDLAKRPPSTALKAISAFNTVVTQYPKSEYAHDALRRMTYLRNRLAEYEVNVAQYYVRRGAYLAAARRAQEAIDQYDGAPAIQDALAIEVDCYKRLGYTELAANSERVYQLNYPDGQKPVAVSKSWWQFWR
jgi:outer membrane protein assembly factor BamD